MVCVYMYVHENSVGLSSTTNPKPKGQPSISLPANIAYYVPVSVAAYMI